jgi:hypothetical protein
LVVAERLNPSPLEAKGVKWKSSCMCRAPFFAAG